MESNVKFIFALVAVAALPINGNIHKVGASFCQANGLKYVIITTKPSNALKVSEVKAFYSAGLRLKFLSLEQVPEYFDFSIDGLVVLAKNEALVDQEMIDVLQSTKIMRSVVLFTDPLSTEAESILSENMKYLSGNAMFYTIHKGEAAAAAAATFTYKQVINVRNGSHPAINSLSIIPGSGVILPAYNLQGLHLFCTSLPWSPYLNLKNCDATTGKNCDTSGFLADFMDAIGRQLNFTWECHVPIDGGWGVTPKSGPFNRSGEWHGAFGGVVNEDYMVSLSQWVWNIERHGLTDFISTSTNQDVLILTPQLPDVDTGLFIRPFRNDAWLAVGLIFVLILLLILVPYAFISYYEHTDGYMITSTTAWYFFVLLNAFYGGALTMFFTSEISIPFKSMEDVMKAYPDWKLMMMSGNDVHFQYKAIQGDPLYVDFWDRVTNKASETVFHTIEEGLDIVQNQRAVIHAMTGMLKGYFQENPFRQQTLKVFAKGRVKFYAIIVPYNSPLKPILQFASNKLQEAGSMDYLLLKWEGKDIASGGEAEMMVLSAGQVVLVFVIVAATFSIAGCIFLGELAHKKLKDRQKAKEQRKALRRQKRLLIPDDLLKFPEKSYYTNKMMMARM